MNKLKRSVKGHKLYLVEGYIRRWVMGGAHM